MHQTEPVFLLFFIYLFYFFVVFFCCFCFCFCFFFFFLGGGGGGSLPGQSCGTCLVSLEISRIQLYLCLLSITSNSLGCQYSVNISMPSTLDTQKRTC